MQSGISMLLVKRRMKVCHLRRVGGGFMLLRWLSGLF